MKSWSKSWWEVKRREVFGVCVTWLLFFLDQDNDESYRTEFFTTEIRRHFIEKSTVIQVDNAYNVLEISENVSILQNVSMNIDRVQLREYRDLRAPANAKIWNLLTKTRIFCEY